MIDNNIPQTPGAPPRISRTILVLILIILGVAIALILFLFIRRQEKGEAPPVVPRPTIDPIPTDHDRDGLTNDEEKALGTSETEFDTDADGISDLHEIRSWGTDPKKFDTDGDGYGDGLEIFRGFNPNGPGKLLVQ